MKIQRMLSNNTWVDEKNQNYFIYMVIERESWRAERDNRSPMTTREQVEAYLATGKEIDYSSDWYAKLRDGDALQPRIVKAVELVKCQCGHTVNSSRVLSTSHGTSCPDCYDAMSN